MSMKRCTKCGQDKPLSAFGVHKIMKDGLRSVCKVCNNDAAKKYVTENRDEILVRRSEYRRKNRDQIKRSARNDYLRNSDRYKKHARARKARIKGATVFKLPNGFEDMLYEFYGNKCLYPGCGASNLTLDHVKPLSRGGDHAWWNFQPLCQFHNFSKHAKHQDYRSGTIVISLIKEEV